MLSGIQGVFQQAQVTEYIKCYWGDGVHEIEKKKQGCYRCTVCSGTAGCNGRYIFVGNLFVITGRRTFSSAVLNAMDLRKGTDAVLLGEPSGGRPNHFGEVKVLHLSNVNLDVFYSSNYFKITREDTDAIYPDFAVKPTAASFFNGRDDCLEYIISNLK